MTTFQDSIDLLVDYLGGTPRTAVQRDCRRAVLEAYRDLTNAFKWSYLLTHGRLLMTIAPIGDGTIAYTASTRRAVLTPLVGSPVQVWPAWSVGAYLRVGQVAGKVVQRIDDTTLLLDEQVNFGWTSPRGRSTASTAIRTSSPRLHRQRPGPLRVELRGPGLRSPREWLIRERFVYNEGNPIIYTITGDSLFPGRLVLRLAPIPFEARTLDYIYHRSPRPLCSPWPTAGRSR
jgi:hypothetical protein